MYEYILQTKLITFAVALAMSWIAACAVGHPRAGLRIFSFNYGPAFACAFFVVGWGYDGYAAGFDLAAGLVFEFLILLAYAALFCEALKQVKRLNPNTVARWLNWSLVLQVVVALPVLTSEGFGVFSEGSRIAYLDTSGAARYLTYAGALVSAVQAGLLAHRLSSRQPMGSVGYGIIGASFALSTLSGSKGSFFLWLIGILALVDYRGLRVRWLLVISLTFGVAAALKVTADIVSETLGISEVEFAELAVSRFFLNNDARALAIELGGRDAPISDLAAASFRGLANLLGLASADPPLGLLLNEQKFGLVNGTGPNASLIALITYYSARGYATLPALLACLGLGVLYSAIVKARSTFRSALSKMVVSLIGLVLVQLLSQDFLAFPLVVPFAIAAGLLLLFTDRKHDGPRQRRVCASSLLAAPQRHHSIT